MERRRGRRDNGLTASDFAAVGDLDPRLAEHLLDLLATRGIAAYLQPSMDVNPMTRSSTVPPRPTDRLYADRAQLAAASDLFRALVAEEGEGTTVEDDQQPNDTRGGPDLTSPEAVDATFAGIVAAYDRPAEDTDAPWPPAENVPPGTVDPPAPTPPATTPPPPQDARNVTEGSLLDGLDTFGADLPPLAEEQERYVPPPPPPLPRISRQAVLGACAIVIGLILVLSPGVGPFDPGNSLWLGFAAILGGAVALILRLRPGNDPDSDQHPDDGAKV